LGKSSLQASNLKAIRSQQPVSEISGDHIPIDDKSCNAGFEILHEIAISAYIYFDT
jgi:hypothetical protein